MAEAMAGRAEELDARRVADGVAVGAFVVLQGRVMVEFEAVKGEAAGGEATAVWGDGATGEGGAAGGNGVGGEELVEDGGAEGAPSATVATAGGGGLGWGGGRRGAGWGGGHGGVSMVLPRPYVAVVAVSGNP
jgi:hypothetical protein